MVSRVDVKYTMSCREKPRLQDFDEIRKKFLPDLPAYSIIKADKIKIGRSGALRLCRKEAAP